MKTFTLCSAFLAVILTAGCSTVSKDELALSDFGTPPPSYESDIKSMMSQRLKDPYSAVYAFQNPRKAVGQDGLLRGGKKYYGYIVPVDINAKNSHGGYAGSERFYFFFTNGRFMECTSEMGQMVKFVE
jgi:hypothetical protein